MTEEYENLTIEEEEKLRALDKQILDIALRWGDFTNDKIRTYAGVAPGRRAPITRVARDITFSDQWYLREFLREAAHLVVPTATLDAEVNAQRLDMLQHMAESGVVTFSFELDGGVSGEWQDVGGDVSSLRNKDSVRHVLDAFRRAEGVHAAPSDKSPALLERRDMDILAQIHHAHGNALQALQNLGWEDKEKYAYWVRQFEHFRVLYSRLHRQLVDGPQTAKSKQYATEEVPSAVVTEDDGFICDMALEYGATLLNDEGTVYSFTEAQLLTFTKANRKPRVHLSDKALWQWYQKNLGTELPHTEAVAVGILKGIIRKVYGDDAFDEIDFKAGKPSAKKSGK